MIFNRKKITAGLLAGLMGFSTLADAGIVARAVERPVFSTMQGSNITVGSTTTYPLHREKGFVSLDPAGTSWDGPLWAFEGKYGPAYCMKLGASASSGNQYALVAMDGNAAALSSELGKMDKAKLSSVMNALGRFMYPANSHPGPITYYMPTYNKVYGGGGNSVNGFNCIGGNVNLNQEWDKENKWMQTFLVVYSANSCFADKFSDDKSHVKSMESLTAAEYQGLSQAVVWEMMGQLPTNGIKATIQRDAAAGGGTKYVHAEKITEQGFINGPLYITTGTTGAKNGGTALNPETLMNGGPDLYKIPYRGSQADLASAIGCTPEQLSNYINPDLVAWNDKGQTQGGALYRLQIAMMIKNTMLQGTTNTAGNSIRYLCSPDELLTKSGSFRDHVKDGKEIGESAVDSSYYLFNFTEVADHSLPIGGGGPVMMTPWCYVSMKAGQYSRCYSDGSGNTIIYDTTTGAEIGAMQGLKLFEVKNAGSPIAGNEVSQTGTDNAFVFAITQTDLDNALQDDRFAEEVDGERRFKQTIGAKWYIYDFGTKQKSDPVKTTIGVAVPSQNRPGGRVTLQENATVQDLLAPVEYPDLMTNGFTYNAPAVLIKKTAKDADGNEVQVTGGSFDILDADGNVVLGGLSINDASYIVMSGATGNSITLPKGDYTIVETQKPTAVGKPDMEFQDLEPVPFSVPLGQAELLLENVEKPKDWWLFGRKVDAETGEVLEGATLRLSKMSGDKLLGYLEEPVIMQVPYETTEGTIPYNEAGNYVIWKIPPEPLFPGTDEEFGGPGTYVIHEMAPPNALESKVLGKTLEYEIPDNLAYPDGAGVIVKVGLNAEHNQAWWNRNFDLTIKNERVEQEYGSLKLEKRISDPAYNDTFSATFGIYDAEGNPYDLTKASEHADWRGILEGTNKVKVTASLEEEGLWGFHIPMLPKDTTLIVKEEAVEPSPPFSLNTSIAQFGTTVRIQKPGHEVDGEWVFDDPNVLKLTNRADGLVNMRLQKTVRTEEDLPVNAPDPILAGFEFTAIGEDGVEYLAKSSVTGVVEWKGIPKQKYTVKETETKGYVPSDPYVEGAEVDLSGLGDGDTYTGFLTAQNRKVRVDFEVTKTGETWLPLQHVQFMIYDTVKHEYLSNGGKDVFTTNPQGKFLVEDIPEGEYTLIEVEAPDGYHMTEDSQQNFTVSYKDLVENNIYYQKIEKTVRNVKDNGQIKIIKYDVDGTRIDGAKFKIEMLNELGGYVTKVITPEITTVNGEFLVDDLKHGVYRVTELSAPDGYVKDPTPQEQEITLDGIYSFSFVNKPETGEIRIQKTVDSNPFGLSLMGAEFQLTGNGVDVVLTTDLDGRASYSGLRFGTYTLQELKAPTGFHMDAASGEPQEVTIDAQHKVVQWNSPKNYPDYGYVTIEKKPRPVTLTGLDLSGFEFRLYEDEQCTTLADPGVFQTDFDGFTRMSVKLKPGTYWFKEEKAPTEWILDATPIRVEVPEGVSSDTPIKVVQFNQRKGSLEIVKRVYNSNGFVPGAEFELRKPDGTVVETLVTNTSGRATSGNLDPGTYTLIETKVPEGFSWPPEVRPGFSDGKNGVEVIIGDATQTLVYNFENDTEKGSILVYKEDKATGEKLKGAEFWLYDDKKVFTGRTATSGEDGLARFDNLELGTYYVKEKKAPSGYDLNYVEFEATLTQVAKEVPIVVENEKIEELFELRVMKYDADSGAQLEGGTFQLYSLDGKKIGDPKVTPASGVVTWTGLAAGQYLVKEEIPPAGYMDTGLSQVVDTANAKNHILAYKFQNKKPKEQKVTLNLVKYGDNISEPLAGVRFKLTNVDTRESWEYTTDRNGQISVTGLPPGNYRWEEVQAANGYLMTRNGKANNETFLVEQGGSHNTYFFNDKEEKEVSVQLFKYVEGTSTPIGGAGFRLWNLSKGTYSEHFTDASGRIFVTGLEPGRYAWEEIYAPQGYVLDSTKYEVNAVNKDETYTTTVFNKKFEDVTLKLIKYEEGTSITIPGAVFELRNVGTGEVREYTTDSYGQIVVTGLPHGQYEWTERSVPTGYVLTTQSKYVTATENTEYTTSFYNKKEEQQVEIVLSKTDTKSVPLAGAEFVLLKDGRQVGPSRYSDSQGRIVWSNLEPGVYVVREVRAPEGYLIVGTGEQTVAAYHESGTKTFYVSFENQEEEKPKVEIIEGSLRVLKVDGSDIPLEGVEFELLRVRDGKSMGVIRTDRNGYATWSRLSPDEYEIVERSTLAGYVLDDVPYPVTVVRDRMETITIRNYEEEGRILVVKKDRETGERLDGARFALYDAQHRLIDEFVVDVDGSYVDHLNVGTYYLEEVQAPNGYVPDDQTHEIDVRSGEVVEVVVYNDRATSTLVINKVDVVDGSPLPNAEFCIWDSSMTRQIVRGNSGPDGLATFTLQPGSYYYQELVAPPGYVIDGNPYPFTLYESGEVKTCMAPNVKAEGVLEIQKLDSGTNRPLAGAVFEVYDESGAVVTQVTTDEDGVVRVGLNAGSYTYKEVLAPSGYYPDSRVISFEITHGTVAQFIHYNDLIVLPKTGDFNAPIVARHIPWMTLGSAMLLLIYSVRNRKEIFKK